VGTNKKWSIGLIIGIYRIFLNRIITTMKKTTFQDNLFLNSFNELNSFNKLTFGFVIGF
jgi:hypothetical protein